jgi:hypothetical protein
VGGDDGNLYGGTQAGGYARTVCGNEGCGPTGWSGTIFEITAAGNAILWSNFGPSEARPAVSARAFLVAQRASNESLVVRAHLILILVPRRIPAALQPARKPDARERIHRAH